MLGIDSQRKLIDNELLIEEVRQYPELFDTSNKLYVLIEHKQQLWNKIGKKLGTSGEAVKSRWASLRDGYRRYLRNKIFKRGSSGCKYIPELSFLKPIVLKRRFKDEYKLLPNSERVDWANLLQVNDDGENSFDINFDESGLNITINPKSENEDENTQNEDENSLSRDSSLEDASSKNKQKQTSNNNTRNSLMMHTTRPLVLDNLLLIEKVRQYPQLYDPGNSQYMVVERKIELWDKIGKEMGTNGDVVKLRWTYLRDKYRAYLRNILYNRRNTNCRYIAELNFLKPIVLKRKFRGDYKVLLNSESTEPENDHPDHVNDEVENDFEIDFIETGDNRISKEENENENTSDQDENTQDQHENSPNTKSFILNVRKDRKRQTTTSDMIIPSFIKRKKPNNSKELTDCSNQENTGTEICESSSSKSNISAGNKNNVDAFLAGITPSLKSLSPIYLNLAKSKIFNIVQHYEMKTILDNCDNNSNSKEKSERLQDEICDEDSDSNCDNFAESLDTDGCFLEYNKSDDEITEDSDPLNFF